MNTRKQGSLWANLKTAYHTILSFLIFLPLQQYMRKYMFILHRAWVSSSWCYPRYICPPTQEGIKWIWNTKIMLCVARVWYHDKMWDLISALIIIVKLLTSLIMNMAHGIPSSDYFNENAQLKFPYRFSNAWQLSP